jgi:thymidylate synthase (FAD)
LTDVKLIAYTQWADEAIFKDEHPKHEDIMSYCARVSNPSNQKNWQTAEKLIKYCLEHKHWSIFEMSNVVLEIETTRDIGRQILRHRSFNFQEFSQRYADPTTDLGFETRELRFQDSKNRQNSIEATTDDAELQKAWFFKQRQIIHEAQLVYRWAIANGIAKEQARTILPEGLTLSRMYINGNVRSWITYALLRTGLETQKEHRIIAEKCWNILIDLYPFLEKIDRSTIS